MWKTIEYYGEPPTARWGHTSNFIESENSIFIFVIK
jgi:hypothetical protein